MIRSHKPSFPALTDVLEVCQPAEIRGRKSSEHWLNDVYLRKLSPYLTRILIPTGISANGVTWVMILSGFLAALSITSLLPLVGLITLFLGQFQMLMDCVDGEVARWRKTSSAQGIFLDKFGHYLTESLIPICLGVHVMRMQGMANYYLVIGLFVSTLVLMNKAFNDMVHVARAFSGLAKLPEASALNIPNSSMLSMLKGFTRILPFQKIFHSVELTALFCFANIIEYINPGTNATKFLLMGLLVVATITVPGHFLAIMNSNRLKASSE